MPRSSKSKSHKQSKHSSREYSDFDEDVKERDYISGGKENGASIKDSKDFLVSGEKRKLDKDLSCVHGNDNVSEEYATPTKRRKERTHGGEDKVDAANLHAKKLKSKELSKEKDESKSDSENRGEKKSDKESGRKDGRHSKENKEIKDKEDEKRRKRGREHTEWPVEEGVRNIELEKELEKRMRRRMEGYKDKDRYHDDVKEGTKSSRKHKDEGHVDNYRETRHKRERERNGDNKQRDRNGRPKKDVDGDQVVRHRENKDRRRGNDKDEGSDYKVCNIKDQNCESEKRSRSDDKVDQISVNHDRHRSSPNGKYYTTRDHHRVSKQEETKSRDYNGNSNKAFISANGQSGKISSRSPEKISQKDDNCINDNNLSQVDSDNLSISTPYTRNNRFSVNHKSFLPPQTNYKNIPYWPSPLPNNNYIPYPSNFNPILHQFPPSLFHQPAIYHETIPHLLHNWEGNNSIFGNGLRGYGRVNWENSNNQVWEDTRVTVGMRSPVQKDEIMFEQTDIQVDTMKNIPEAMKVKKEDDSIISRVYLSKIDISKEITESDLYDQCTRILDLDQESVSDEFDCKILFLEEVIEDDVSNGASLFAAINNSIFKKAMSLYTKQRARNEAKTAEDGDAGVEDSSGDVDAGVKDSGNISNGGSCLLIEFESVNLSRIHHNSLESTQ
ncbi:hypothetical protein L1887_00290 [Cichorium endivia]|nr:hypothetical protein L1887_00290 [Cichorium endivia]